MIDPIYPFVAAAFVVGAAKGGLTSAGSLAVPALSLLVDPLTAAGMLLPVFILSDVVGVWLYRREYSGPNVLVLGLSGLVGVGLMAIVVPYVSVAWATLMTGAIGLVYVAQVNARRLRAVVVEDRPFRLLPGIVCGMLAGATSFVSHSGSPPYQYFVLPQRLPKMVYAGTSTLVFATINLSKWPAYAAVGLFGSFTLRSFVPLAVAAVAGTFFGRWLSRRLSDRIYLAAIEILLLLISIYLVAEAVHDLWR